MTAMSISDVLEILRNGVVEIEGLLPWSSNYAFLVRVCEGPTEVGAVYKPRRGERPLWDFPQGTLCQRELMAFLVSEALGWHLVPPTVLRDAQHGPGTIQFFIDHDPEHHYFKIEGDKTYEPQLKRMALLDLIINNADRKAGHVLLEESQDHDHPGRIWGIDHGICFHSDPKLRTVIWEFAGTPLPPELTADMVLLRERLNNPDDELALAARPLLAPAEIRALDRRLGDLIERTTFPQPGAGRHYPWPPV
jgi:uncharacterized repeat protein (TIGR03843 family)